MSEDSQRKLTPTQRRNARRRHVERARDNRSGELLKGYRLHDARIDYSGGVDSMRSVKFELLNLSATRENKQRGVGLQSAVAQAIHDDYLTLYGPQNLEDYLANPDSPNFVELWIRALNLGFILSNKSESDYKTYAGVESDNKKYFDAIPEQLRENLDFARWDVWLRDPVRPKSGTAASLTKKITDLFKVPGPEAEHISEQWLILCDQGAQNDKEQKLRLFAIDMPYEAKKTEAIYWCIDPTFEPFNESDRTKLIDKILGFWSIKQVDVKKFIGLGENGNNFNKGLFGDLIETLQADEATWQAKLDNLAGVFDFDYEQQRIVRERFLSLRGYALSIQTAKMVDSWAKYRSDFNGTLESWYSNYQGKDVAKADGNSNKGKGKKGIANEQLESLSELLWKIDTVLCPLSDVKAQEIREGVLAETMRLFGGKYELSREFTEQLESYMATLRSELNALAQKSEGAKSALNAIRGERDEETEKRKGIDWQKELGKHIQSSPLFYGEAKRELWRKLVNLKSLVITEAEVLTQTHEGLQGLSEITDKQVDQLAVLWNRLNADPTGNGQVIAALERIESALGVKFADTPFVKDKGGNVRRQRRFFVTNGRYEHERITKLDVNRRISLVELKELAGLDQLYGLLKSAPQQDNALRDVVQLSKVVLSALAYDRDIETRRRILLAHSNLQGYSALLSRSQFISRGAVQAVNGQQVQFVTAKNGGENKPDRYLYALPLMPLEAGKYEIVKPATVFDFSKKEMVPAKAKRDEHPALAVASSRYQVQFLDWATGKLAKSRKTTLQIGGAFSIFERPIEISWEGDKPELVSVGEPRVFVSQPFTLVAAPESETRVSTELVSGRYLGVDIGEHSLAWSLIQVDPQDWRKVALLESGFIEDNQQQTIKNYVKSWRESQARQTFTSIDTKLARLRESLIGAYRNQLEALALAKHARLSFEYEVSAFETGGSRVAKVYDSIKQGSIRRDNDVENKQAWGELGNPKKRNIDSKDSPQWDQVKQDWNLIWGFETSAGWTSQYCTKCGSVATQVLEKLRLTVNLETKQLETVSLGKEYKAHREFYRVCRPDLGDGRLREYAERRVGAMLASEEPLEEQLCRGKEWVDHVHTTQSRCSGEHGQNSSTIGLFICPNPECNHVTDADIQASFNIAVRGYIKDNPELFAAEGDLDKDGKWKQGVLVKTRFVELQNDLDFAPVDLGLS